MNDLIDFDDFSIIRLLERTKFASVSIAEKKVSPKKKYIFKTFEYECKNSKAQKIFAQTFYITHKVQHYTLLSYKKFSFVDQNTSPKVTFVSKYISQQTLEKALSDDIFLKNWGMKGILNCIFAIAVGLSHLHSRLVYHGNLCLSNIIIDDVGQSYICDFGLYPIKKLYIPLNEISSLNKYYAKSNNISRKPSDKDDIFAFGIIVCQLLDSSFPKISGTSIQNLYLTNSLNNSHIPDLFKKLIPNCLDPIPEKRLSMHAIIELFQNNNSILKDIKICKAFTTFLDSNYIINLANNGDAFALNKLGGMYSQGKGVPKDDAKAMECYFKAAQKGHTGALSNYGVALQESDGNKKNSANGAEYLRQSAIHADLYGMANYGIALREGDGVNKDYNEGMMFLKQAADHGLPYAQVNYGLSLIELDDIRKKKEGCEYIKLAVDQGDVDAIYTLGICFLKGDGVDKDEKTAMEYFKMAADKGYSKAQYEYAIGLLNGLGVQKNISDSLDLFKLALKGGYEEARSYIESITNSLGVNAPSRNDSQVQTQIETSRKKTTKLSQNNDQNTSNFALKLFYSMKHELDTEQNLRKEDYEIFRYEKMFVDLQNAEIIDQYATIYDEHPIFQDTQKANEYYKIAALLGNPNSQANYGVFLQEEKNEKELGFKFLYESAKQNNVNGMLNLGLAYIYGDGVKIDLKTGLEYIKKAAKLGDPKAQLNYGILLQNTDMPVVNMEKGAKYIKKAADSNNLEALKQYAICLENGEGVETDIQKASSIFEQLYINQNHDEDTLDHLINCLQVCDPQRAEEFIKIKVANHPQIPNISSQIPINQHQDEPYPSTRKTSNSKKRPNSSSKIQINSKRNQSQSSKNSKVTKKSKTCNAGICQNKRMSQSKSVKNNIQSSKDFYQVSDFEEENVGKKNRISHQSNDEYSNFDNIDNNLSLSELIEYGDHYLIQQDPDTAYSYYEKASLYGDPIANFKAGQLCLDFKRKLNFLSKAIENNVDGAFEVWRNALIQHVKDCPHDSYFVAEQFQKLNDYSDAAIYYDQSGSKSEFHYCLNKAKNNIADIKNPNQQYDFARLLDKNEEKNLALALSTEAVKNGHSDSEKLQESLNNYHISSLSTEPDMSKRYFNLGIYFFEGRNLTPIDYNTAYQYFCQALAYNNPLAVNYIGIILQKGLGGIPKNEEKAAKYFQKSAESGNLEGKFQYAYCLENGIGIKQDIVQALKIYKEAADSGHPSAQFRYGILRISLFQDGISEQYLKLSADNGYSEAMYEYSKVKQNDPIESKKYFKMALKNNYPQAIKDYGKKLIKKDKKEKAFNFFKSLADKKIGIGYMYYAQCFEEEIGIDYDITKAEKYYKLAAETGDPKLQYKYAMFLLKEHDENKKEAVKYFRLLSEQGFAKAYFHYAECLRKGDGVPKNLSEASKYFKLSLEKDPKSPAKLILIMLKREGLVD